VGTSEFLESELEKLKERLESREQELATYRARHMGGLPDELETNLRTLDRLQIQHTDALNALRETQNNISILKTQIAQLKQGLQVTAGLQPDGMPAPLSNLSSTEQQYEREKRQLDELLLKYTEKHPEVVRLQKSVARLREKIETEAAQGASTGTPDAADSERPLNRAVLQQEFVLKQLQNERDSIRKKIASIEQSMQVYQQRVEDTPKREQELQSIQRDYNNIRASYNSLLGRRLEAELAVNMEKKQKGEQFRIIDYARLPEKPISPDVRMLFMLFTAVALGVGGGIIFLLEFLNPVIRSENQIETEMGLPVLASIPPLVTPGDIFKQRLEIAAFSLTACYAFAVLMLFGLLYLQGITKTLSLFQAILKF